MWGSEMSTTSVRAVLTAIFYYYKITRIAYPWVFTYFYIFDKIATGNPDSSNTVITFNTRFFFLNNII